MTSVPKPYPWGTVLHMTLTERLLEVAGDQRGFVTPGDAEAVGVNPVELRKMAARGRLERVGHAVYRLPTFPHRPNDELMVAVLWTGKRGVIAGEAALALHDLCDVNPRRIDVAVPPGYRPRKAGGEHYRVRTAALRPRDLDVVDGIPTVTPAVAIGQGIEDYIDPQLIEQAIRTGRRRGDFDQHEEQQLRQQMAAAMTASHRR